MFLSFIGFSFFFHLSVIALAAVFNWYRGRKHQSAFQTYGKHGGWFNSPSVNVAVSYAIVTLVATYIFSVLFFAIRLALQTGADEPQVIMAKSLMAVFATAMVTVAVNEFFFVTVGVGLAAIIMYVLYTPVKTMVAQPSARILSGAATAVLSGIGLFRLFVLIVLGGSLFGIPAIAGAQILEPGFEKEVVAGGFALPTATAFAPDGRIFVAEKNGIVKVIKNGAVLSNPLITLTDINTFGDRGLIGMAIDPNFASNGYLYLSYTYENTPGFNPAAPKTGRIVRVTVVGDTASESSKVVLVGTVGGDATAPSCEDVAVTADCIASDSSSHSVGALTFGTDGKLYASLGDGADFAAVDPRAFRAQDLDALAGKVLRINTDGTAPTDNPFYTGDPNDNRSKVYAYGFRNQFRLAFNETTGRLYGGDVGWSDWEEVNDIQAGLNYGWPCREGANDSPYNCTNPTPDTDPLYDYAHNSAGAGAIIIGAFGANGVYPAQYDNSLFIGDYAQQWIKRLIVNPDGSLDSVIDFENGNFDLFPAEFNTGADGNVYYLDIAFGTLNRLTHTSGNRTPVVSANADLTSGLAPLTVNFSSVGTFDPDTDPLTYQWSFGDGAFSNTANPTHTYTTNGVYNAALTATDNQGAAASASIDITVGDQKPNAVITSPASGSLYTPLEEVVVSGDGFDPEDGTLPASAFEWTVLLHHNTHVHTQQQFSGVKDITFVADDHNALDVYMEIILTVTDSAGLTDTKSINMYLNNGGGSGNLVNNPSLETADPNLPSQPLNWLPGWFGSMSPFFEYPVAGLSGNTAARVSVANHSAGAARWYFAPVQITPEETYTFSHVYIANATTSLTAEFTNPDGTKVYNLVTFLPAVNEATPTSYDITVPAGAQFMTVFHDLYSDGTVTVDEYSLVLASEGGGGNPGTPTTSGNLVQNSDFELDNGDGSPFGWTAGGWGTHERVLTYPVAGYNSDNAVRVEITEYELSDTGDSKWRHDTIPVEPGTEYMFTTYYRSDTISDVIAQYTMEDGSFVYQGIGKEIQPSTDWALADGSFIAPDNSVSMSAFHLISAVGYLEIDDVTIVASSTGNTSETNAPYVAWESHATGDVVSGVVTFVASSSDDTEVVGVYYGVNGTFTATEDFEAPYTLTLDTTEYADGDYILKATSHDVFGNNDVDEIIVTFDNSGTVTPTDDNLVFNGDFEILDGPNDPSGWRQGGYGTNDTNYTVVSTPAGNVGYVEIFNYTNGDAKWVFEDVDVVPGETYRFNVDYSSKNSNEVVAFYRLDDGETYRAELLDYSPAYDTDSATDLTNYSIDFVVPNDAEAVTVFHTPLVIDVNELSYGYIDNVSIEQITGDPIDPPTGDNLILNGNLNSALNGQPENWFQGGWGTNDAVFTYPVTGVEGNGARVELTSYTSGDAKWYFTDVPVLPNEDYTFDFQYRANTTTDITVRYTLDDGSIVYDYIGGVPVSTTWTDGQTRTLTTPADAVSLTVFNTLSSVGFLELDQVSLTGDGGTTGPGPDVTPPTITITNPANNATVSDTITVTVDATDASGVDVVALSVDGTLLGFDATSPYSFVLDTTAYADGTYTLLAEASDAVGNDAAVSIAVTFDNSGGPIEPPTGDNLILNGNLNSALNGQPENWFQGGWGTNDAVFTYPVTGVEGNGARVEMTSYTSGDAKWYFNSVPVVAGEVYAYSHQYQSDVATDVIAQYTLADGTFQYDYLAGLPAAGVWTVNSGNTTAPANATAVTFFHNLSSVGYLEIDNWELLGESGTVTPPAGDTESPAVQIVNPASGSTLTNDSFVEVDAADNVGVTQLVLVANGVIVATDTTAPYSFSILNTGLADGTYTLRSEAADAAGNIGVSTEITIIIDNSGDPVDPPTGDNLVLNGNLNSALNGQPENWFQGGWGTNDATFVYPVAGVDGNGARVELVNYVSGDAKWFFTDVPVTAGNDYIYTFDYRSDVATDITIRYTRADNSVYYEYVGGVAASADWTPGVPRTITVPADAVSMTIFNTIAADGYLELDNVRLIEA